MKTICFFSGDITRGGGTERVAAMIANALARQKSDKICFLSLVEQEAEPFFFIDPGITRHVLGEKWIQPGPGYLAIWPKLRKFLKREKPDVLIDIDLVLDVLSVPMCKGLPVKVISWGHFAFSFEREVFYRRLIQNYSAKGADYIVTINRENLRQYAEVLGRTDRIRTIYNPIEEPGEDDAAQGAAKREKWILTVGRLETIKGPDLLLQVAERVLPAHGDWMWMVAGSGSLMEELTKQSEALGLSAQLKFLGKVDRVEEYYRKSSVFALTSRSEGLPMCLLEAKSYGLPCVSFDIQTGPREILQDGKDGFLVPPGDCEKMAESLARLMEDEALRERFSQNTKTNLEAFRMEGILASWNEVIEGLCS